MDGVLYIRQKDYNNAYKYVKELELVTTEPENVKKMEDYIVKANCVSTALFMNYMGAVIRTVCSLLSGMCVVNWANQSKAKNVWNSNRRTLNSPARRAMHIILKAQAIPFPVKFMVRHG